MAAERAAELSDKKVVVVPTRSQQAGLAAAVALDPAATPRPTPPRWTTRSPPCAPARSPSAARDDAEERPARFHRGDAVGFVDERIVAWGEPGETLEAVLGELGREAELLTLIAGDGAPLDERRGRRRSRPTGVELEYSLGRPAGLLVADRGRVARAARSHVACRLGGPHHAARLRRRRCADAARARRAPSPRRAEPLADAADVSRARRRRAPSGSGWTRSATCSSTCRATARRRARSPSWRRTRSPPSSSRCARSPRGRSAGAG